MYTGFADMPRPPNTVHLQEHTPSIRPTAAAHGPVIALISSSTAQAVQRQSPSQKLPITFVQSHQTSSRCCPESFIAKVLITIAVAQSKVFPVQLASPCSPWLHGLLMHTPSLVL